MKSIITPVVFCALGSLLHAQMPAELVNAERAKILDGVKTVPRIAAPGPVAIYGLIAFPILSAAPEAGQPETAVAAAGAMGKGRAIIFGHNGYLDGSNSGAGDLNKLVLNCVKWCGNKEKPRVALKGAKLESILSKAGIRVEKITDPLELKTLKDYDVVILNAQGLTDEGEGNALKEYIDGGGGFIGGMTGWAFEQTSGGKTLSVSHAGNKALAGAGLGWTDMSFSDKIRSFDARVDVPPMLNAFAAITALRKQREGGPALQPAEVQQGASAIQIAMAAQPPGKSALQSAVANAIGGSSEVAIPTPESPLTEAKNASARIRLGMDAKFLKLADAEGIQAHPAADTFPGRAPADAPRVTKEVQVDPSIPGWHSTGLWADAGEKITITVPAAIAGSGFAVRIGCHTDILYNLDKWLRVPDISRSMPIEQQEVVAANAFGGLIYIEVPGRAKTEQPFTVTLKGGVEAPLFVLGKDTDDQWNIELKKRPAPWAELACDKMIVSCPTEVARAVSNPTQLMGFWKQVVEAQDDVANQTSERRRPERIVADVQISAGYMHSGYPIMIPTSAAPEMVTFGRLKFPGWGFYHEIGHNHQRGDFTFDGTGEVTNNVIGMYCYEAVLKKDWLIGHPAISDESRKEHIQAIRKSSNKWQEWKSNPFVALTTYIQLIQAFGWESWRKYLYSFGDPSFGEAPGNDDEKRDQFLIRYSKIANKNLGPFFDFWGIPVSSQAKTEVEKLEPWMPKGL